MELEIQNAIKITRSDIKSGSYTDKKWRTITIETDKGEQIEITCWNKKFNNLILKEEE